MRATRIMVLGCSSSTTGELTMALDFLRRTGRDLELHTVVGAPLVTHAKAYGGTLHLYPPIDRFLAVTRIREIFRKVQPDVVLVADLLLMLGFSLEFGDGLRGLLVDFTRASRCVALDLYDVHRTGHLLDVMGTRLPRPNLDVPHGVGRLHPAPSLPPAKSTAGHGRYQMLEDHGPLAPSERARVRESLALPSSIPLVVTTTSAWQHRLPRRHPRAAAVTRAFPRYLLSLVEQAGPLHLVHVGGEPFEAPANLRYQHIPSLPREAFLELLGAADLHLSTNVPSSTAVRAASLRVPIVTFIAGRTEPTFSSSPAGLALRRYVDETAGARYPFMLWPSGTHDLMQHTLDHNPFATVQKLVDIHDADRAVSTVQQALQPAHADEIRHAQSEYFALLGRTMDTPAEALDHALMEPA